MLPAQHTYHYREYRRFCVAISAYLKFLAAVDDLVLVMKGTLGESHIVSRDLRHPVIVATVE
jgi:hypothetical protein